MRVDATKFEGWFYEGAGIYRQVWLDKTAPLAIAPDGIFVYSKFKNNVPSDEAEIHVEANLLNTLTNAVAAAVNCEIISPEGKSLARFKASGNVAGSIRGSCETGIECFIANSLVAGIPETLQIDHERFRRRQNC